MRIYETINLMRSRLPLERASRSFVEALQHEFSEYVSLLNNIDEADFNTLFKNEGSPIIRDLTKRKFISFIKSVQNTITSIINVYYEGYPDEAYRLLESLLERNKFAPTREGVRCAYARNYLNENLKNYFSFDLREEFGSLYRMRIANKTLSEKELFHVPYNMRERISTARFSIPGFPCLYLGTSLEVCWKELERPLEKGEKAFACRYENHKCLALVNLTIPDKCSETILDTESNFIFRFLATYPFYLSCLVKVEYPGASFKPEYIIPQLLLQYVRKQNMFDGIIYSSTKDRTLVGERYRNIVIPVRNIAVEGHCEMAKRYYYTTDSSLVDLTNINKTENELENLPTRILP